MGQCLNGLNGDGVQYLKVCPPRVHLIQTCLLFFKDQLSNGSALYPLVCRPAFLHWNNVSSYYFLASVLRLAAVIWIKRIQQYNDGTSTTVVHAQKTIVKSPISVFFARSSPG